MKQVFCAVLACLLLAACGGGGAGTLEAGEVRYHDKVLIYGAAAADVKEVFQEAGVNLTINGDGHIRAITISGAEVETYRGISVGDAVEKVKASYQYETEAGGMISAIVNGRQELKPDAQGKPDGAIWINYRHDGGTITSITIYDVAYGLTMK